MFIKRAVDWFRSALDFGGETIVVECMGPKRRDSVRVVINQNRVCFDQIVIHKSG
jgi:hypothetical protein